MCGCSDPHSINNCMSTVDNIGYNNRNQLINELRLRLGDQMVDVELDREHYDIAVNLAMATYRQRSAGSVEDAIIFVKTEPGVTEYVLPNEVIDVHRIYRRGIGTNNSGGVNFDPFDVAFNNMYMLQAGQLGGIAVFDAFAQYKETISRIFGGEYDFRFNRNTKILKILRNVNHEEDIAISVYNFVPEMVLLKDIYASNWLSNYALAECKYMLGEARSKFTTGLPGPGGSVSLNGEQLKSEAQQEKDALMEEIKNMSEGSEPLGFVIG